MKFTKVSFTAFLLIVVFAYGQNVHYNYDRGANFAAYKTYQWVDLPGRVPDQLIDQDIKRSIDEQLAQKGLTKFERDTGRIVDGMNLAVSSSDLTGI